MKPPRVTNITDGDDDDGLVPPTPPGTGGMGERGRKVEEFDHSVRSPWSSSRSPWTGSEGGGIMESLGFTPTRSRRSGRKSNPKSLSPGYCTYSKEILSSTPTPQSSDYTVNEDDYLTHTAVHRASALTNTAAIGAHGTTLGLAPKFSNSYLSEIWILTRRNFTNIRRTPELFLSRQVVLTVMASLMATMFLHPDDDVQGVTNRLSFFIFTACIFFFSSNDAVPAFIQERFVFVRESSHNAYRASSYAVSGLLTYLPFLLVQAATYAVIVWRALRLRGGFPYFVGVLYMSLLSTNSFVMFVSSVVPSFILGYAAVIAFTALFFLFCGYFLDSASIPRGWRWMNTVSTIKYPYEGMLMNEFRGDHVFAVDPAGRPVYGDDILRQMSIGTRESDRWRMLLCMLGWAVFYRVLFYLVLRFASKNLRN